ncbi:MAG: SemiSWEET transporter [Betaproteobacteria bacterium]|jgi:MtN3 and saliva related transmembrane protein|nr:SemiSWEET transporter [Betaproteobacteria bacterium]MDH5287302.1 SemiSWEET transporter [Betaproteobacteria bacterium]
MSDETIGLAAAFLTTAAYVPQVVRIVRTRSAHDISWWMFATMTVGAVLWLVYGLRLPSLPVAAANAVVLVQLAAILLLKWRYGRDVPASVPRSIASRKN